MVTFEKQRAAECRERRAWLGLGEALDPRAEQCSALRHSMARVSIKQARARFCERVGSKTFPVFFQNDQGFHKSDQGFQKNDQRFGWNDQGLAENDQAFLRDDQGFGKSGHSFPQNDQGFRKAG